MLDLPDFLKLKKDFIKDAISKDPITKEELIAQIFYNIYKNNKDKAIELIKKYIEIVPDTYAGQPEIIELIEDGVDLIKYEIKQGKAILTEEQRKEFLVNKTYKELKKVIERSRSILSDYFPTTSKKLKIVKSYPPCINTILERSKSISLPHIERFALALYFVNIGWNEDDIVDLYRTQPNFKEHKTRYHINYIKKKQYSMFSCQKMKELGLCVADCKIKNPIQWKG
jgi:DNA primase large subunit